MLKITRVVYRPTAQEVTIYNVIPEDGTTFKTKLKVENRDEALRLVEQYKLLREINPGVELEEETNTVYGLLKSAGSFGNP